MKLYVTEHYNTKNQSWWLSGWGEYDSIAEILELQNRTMFAKGLIPESWRAREATAIETAYIAEQNEAFAASGQIVGGGVREVKE